MLAPLIEPYKSSAYKLLALAIWREARGESIEAKMAVASVIHNRCVMHPAEGFGRTTSENILKPFAFSSFMEGDPNAYKYPAVADPSWHDSLIAAQTVLEQRSPDRSCGAVFYHDDSISAPSTWGHVQPCAAIGRLRFYRLVSQEVPV